MRLRISFEEKIDVPKRDQIALLNESPLVSKLTDGIVFKPLPAIFRLTCMAEIPFLYDLPETRALVAYAGETLSTQHGFTYTGNDDEIVPCYNAMLLESFVRFGLAEHPASQKALKWIKDYQVFERDEKTSWKGKGICKHGGCMKSVPCYIGIGKTVRALLTYQEFTGGNDKEIDAYIQRGVEYMLKHRLYKRLTNGEPISAHITDLMFPQSY
ncbi:MAG: hypothetical protein RR672_11005, partial [Raoultibacter sp.]